VDAVDTARFEAGGIVSNPVIEDSILPGCKIVSSIVYALDIGCETTNFQCHNVEVRRTVARLLARCVGIARC